MNPLLDCRTRMLASGFTIAAQAATAVAATVAGSSAAPALLIGSVVLTSLSGLAGNCLVTDFHDQLQRPTPDPDAGRWNNDILRASALAISDILRKHAADWNASTAASVTTLADTVAILYDEVDDHDPLAVVTESEVRQSMEKGDAFRQEAAGSSALWTAFLHHVIQTHSTLPTIAQRVLDALGEAIAHGFNNQLFQVLKFDFDADRSPIHGYAYADITLKLLMQSAATQRETLQQISDLQKEQREQNAAVLAELSAGLASALSQTVSVTGRGGGLSSTERKEFRHLAKTLKSSASELRASRESLSSLHSLPAKIATLIDASLDQVQDRLIDLQRGQTEVKEEVHSSRKKILAALAAVLLLVALVGSGVWLVKRDTRKVKDDAFLAKQNTEQVLAAQKVADEKADALAAQTSEMQKQLSEMAQRANLANDPISKWPQDHVENELAKRMKMKVEDLRALLAAGRTSLDALVAGQALLASGKSEDAGKKFDLVLQQEKGPLDRVRQAWEGKAQIALDAVHYDEALEYRQKAAALMDKTAEPLAWADAQEWVTFVLQKLARYKEAEPLNREIVRIRDEKLDPNDPKLATALSNLAQLLQSTDRLTEAEPLMRRAVKIVESSYGMEDPAVSPLLGNLGTLLFSSKRYAEAEPLMRRALKIDEKSGGVVEVGVDRTSSEFNQFLQRLSLIGEGKKLQFRIDRDAIPRDLNNLAQLLQATKRLEEAELLSRRAMKIILESQRASGHEHVDFKTYASNYANVVLDKKPDATELRAKIESLAEESGMEKTDVMTQFLSIFGPFDVTVTSVVSGSQGLGLGIRVGDIIRRYNGEAINQGEQLVKLTGETKDEAISVEIQRGSETLKLTAKPGRLGLRLENKLRK